MNWDAIGALSELIGAVAVVLTLAYLASQIRQNTKMMSAQAYQSRSDALMDLSMRVAESETLSSIQTRVLLRKGGTVQFDDEAINSLTPTEYAQFRNYLIANVHRMDNLLKQYELGYLDEEYFQRGILGTAQSFWIPAWDKFDVTLASRFRERLSVYADDQ
jgi:hypothetical protein